MTKQKTLPDFLSTELTAVSIGINPSLHSVDAGYPFSSQRNRFWPALNQSKLVNRRIEPSAGEMQQLLSVDKIGFTDIVKRPTKGISELNAADYRQGTMTLLEKITEYRPQIAWFQGMTAARYFYKYSGLGRGEDVVWGVQKQLDLACLVFVSPNPSSANASFSLQHLIQSFDHLAELIQQNTG